MTELLKFYSLLHISAGQAGSGNLVSATDAARVKVYVDCALSLDASLRAAGARLTLLTNNRKAVKDIVGNDELIVEEINFGLAVPSGIAFFSAHYKIDVFRHFSGRANEYSILLDLDMVLLNPVVAEFSELVRRGVPAYYDITSQILPAYGSARVGASMRLIDSECFENRWAGGEFIAGSSDFYSSLVAHVDYLWPKYLRHHKELFHNGDEMIVSVALERMRRRGWYISDAGTLGMVARYWSGLISHPQPAFNIVASASILHLPQEKMLLARCNRDFERTRFLRTYAKWRVYRRLRSAVATCVKAIKRSA
ncbi:MULTISPECIES: hypothetical protein [Ramlibacter]|uniref:Glycosyl transferase n=1 Tax=Ramlibacter pinisoli TaxID=2682844 RepID=A0A6N8IS83_9BURK|nr:MULTISPECIES: hypothetical protein [Ramlibacter]MBA2964814.1 hypothetical protein [Ramlibacter sp. CGMCC 1.13660]MVQ29779.1 hypothetical protein [Ramlibacter pinisoli]